MTVDEERLQVQLMSAIGIIKRLRDEVEQLQAELEQWKSKHEPGKDARRSEVVRNPTGESP